MYKFLHLFCHKFVAPKSSGNEKECAFQSFVSDFQLKNTLDDRVLGNSSPSTFIRFLKQVEFYNIIKPFFFSLI